MKTFPVLRSCLLVAAGLLLGSHASAAELVTLDGLKIHPTRRGTYWYFKSPDKGLDEWMGGTATIRKGMFDQWLRALEVER